MENLGEKFVEHQKALFGYALYLTHNACDAQELMQETALSVLRGAGSYHEKGQFVQWIHTIMRNCYINQIKRNQRICIVSGYDVFDESCTITAVAETECGYACKDIQKLIATLPPRQATSLSLAIEGYSYDEIAKATGTSLCNVKNRLRAARVALRKKIDW